MIELTDWATDILRRSHQAATRFNPDAKLRLATTSSGVQAQLAEQADPDDTVVEADGFTLYVQAGLEGLVDVREPHDQIVLRPAGSTPNPREH